MFDGVSTRLAYPSTLVGTSSVMAQTVFYSFVRMIGLTNCIKVFCKKIFLELAP